MRLQDRFLGFRVAVLLKQMAVQGVEVGQGARFDDVSAAAFACYNAPHTLLFGELDADSDFADGIFAAGDTVDGEIQQAAAIAGYPVDRLERGVDRAVAGTGIGHRFLLAGVNEAHAGLGNARWEPGIS